MLIEPRLRRWDASNRSELQLQVRPFAKCDEMSEERAAREPHKAVAKLSGLAGDSAPTYDQRGNLVSRTASGNIPWKELYYTYDHENRRFLDVFSGVMVGSKPFARRMRGCFARVHGAIPSPSAIRETLSAYQPLPAQPVSLASTLQVCLDITRDRTSSASRPINGPKQFRPPEPSVPRCGETAKKRTQGRQGGGSNPCAGRWGRRRASEAPAARAKLHPHPPIPPVSLQSQISSMAHAACRQ